MKKIIFSLLLSVAQAKLVFGVDKLDETIKKGLSQIEEYISKVERISTHKEKQEDLNKILNNTMIREREREVVKKKIQSALNEDADAQYFIANLYLNGRCGIDVNVNKAVNWFIKSSKNNNFVAMRELHTLLSQKQNHYPLTQEMNQKTIASGLLTISKKNLGENFDIY